MAKALVRLSDIESAGTLSQVGFQPTRELSFDEWERCGLALQRAAGAVQWWLGDWLNYGELRYGEKYAQAIEDTPWAHQTLRDTAWMAGKFEMSRRRDILSWSHHREVAALEPKEQDALLDAAEAGAWTRQELRKAVRDYRKQLAKPEPLAGTYRVIYADPPWQYRDELVEGYGAAEHHYPTLTLDELIALPVQEITPADAVCFLWVTSPMLPDGIRLLTEWGFEYKSSFVWDKVKHNYGHYNSVRHELLLVATRGSCTPDTPELVDSVQQIDRSDHSGKPEEFRQIIDSLYTEGPRVELFARKATRGWAVWGNEV